MENGIITAWFVFSILVGFLGYGRKIGFAGAFFLSLLFSPLIGCIFAFASERIDPKTIPTHQAKKLIVSGNIKLKRNDYDGAIHDFQEVIKIQPYAPVTNYQLARLYSLTENKTEAYKHLSMAIEQGFRDLFRIKQSPDFAFLRNQDDFNEFALNGYKLNSSINHSTDNIEKLANLKKEGFLSENEFEEQKRNILNF